MRGDWNWKSEPRTRETYCPERLKKIWLKTASISAFTALSALAGNWGYDANNNTSSSKYRNLLDQFGIVPSISRWESCY
ncbi:MAG: hypothetical protein ABIR84_02450, partial [Candidatus Nitrotoga sp.]